MKEKILGNLTRGLVYVVSAPAGTGKTTLVRMLINEFPCITESVSCTTRSPRPGEIDGIDYHFLQLEQFEARIKNGDFLEYAKVFNDYYGTSSSNVSAEQAKGNHVVLVIDTQGAMQLKAMGFDATFIFLKPPSMEELRQRLLRRKTEDSSALDHRLSWARKEMDQAGQYDYIVVNGDLSIAYNVLKSIFIAEEHKAKYTQT